MNLQPNIKVGLHLLFLITLTGCLGTESSSRAKPADLLSFESKTLFFGFPKNRPSEIFTADFRDGYNKAKLVALSRLIIRGNTEYYYAAEVLKDVKGSAKQGDLIARWERWGGIPKVQPQWALVFIDDISWGQNYGHADMLYEEISRDLNSFTYPQIVKIMRGGKETVASRDIP